MNRNNIIVTLLFLLLLVQAGIIKVPQISSVKVDRVTYVYEKDEGAVPPPVSYALRKLNENGIIATELEVDPLNGLNGIPTQDKVAVEAGKREGLPALVVQSGQTVTKVVKKPTTVEEVSKAVGIEVEEPN